MTDTCEQVLVDLDTYLDGECPQNIEAVIRDHLGRCSPCLGRADFEQRLRALIAAKCRDVAPPGLGDRIVASLHAG